MNDLITPDFGQVLKRDASIAKKEMLRVDKIDGKTIVYINSSSLSIIQSCPRKSYYLLERKLKSNIESPALVFGSAIHKALEVFYSTPPSDREMPDKFEERAHLLAHNPEADFGDHPFYKAIRAFVMAGQSLLSLPDTDKRSIVSGVWILGHYFQTYIRDEFTVYHDDQGPVTERTFVLKIMDHPTFEINIFGTIDLVLRNEITKELFPADHKTSSTMGTEFLNRIKPNHQYTGYIMGAQQVLGIDCEKFMVNGIQVKPIPKTSRGTPPNFTRQITSRNEDDITEYLVVINEAVFNYLRWKKDDVWPLGPVDSCAHFGGCQFLDVCSSPKNIRNNILEGKYDATT